MSCNENGIEKNIEAHSLDNKDEKLRKDILVRLRRIEGQVKGIQGMIDRNVCCKDVLVQIAAIRSATNKVGTLLLENYARNCMGVERDTDQSKGLEELIKTLNTFMK